MSTKLKMLSSMGLALLPFIATPAAAAPASGQISFGGYAQAVGATGMGGATGISFANASGSLVAGTSGILTSYGAGSGSFASLGACSSTTTGCGSIKDIATLASASNINAFLTLGGLQTVTFDLASLDSVVRSQDAFGGSLTFTASGTINEAGYNPTPGRFILTSQGNNIVSFSATLLASSVAAAVPEPASWAMMILGMGLIGFTMRRRNGVSTTVKFA